MGSGGNASSIFPAKKNPIHKLQKTFSWSQKKSQDEDSVVAALQPEPEPAKAGGEPPKEPLESQPPPSPAVETAATEPPPADPASGTQQIYTIDVPEAAKPGMALKVRLPDRGMVKITVPEGCVPGNQLEFTLPAVLTPSKTATAPKSASGSGSAAADQAAAEVVSSAVTGAIANAEATRALEMGALADSLVEAALQGAVD